MNLHRARLSATTILLAVSSLTSGCSDPAKTPPPGELVVAIQTDMKLPEDIDTVGIMIKTNGHVAHMQEYPVGPPSNDPKKPVVQIPATIAIASHEPDTKAEVELWGRQNGKLRVFRQVITTVPNERVALLPMPLSWLCDGSGLEDEGIIMSGCGAQQTCNASRCIDANISSDILPDYQPESVFGGATDPNDTSNGSCMDALACFEHATELTPTNGTFDLDNLNTTADHVNIALQLPPGSDGICTEDRCLIVLDQDKMSGWHLDGRTLILPTGLQENIIDKGKAQPALLVSTSCPTKTSALPLCGPWSSTGNGPNAKWVIPDRDAAPPPQPDASSSDGSTNNGEEKSCKKPSSNTKATVCVQLDWEKAQPIGSDPNLDGKGRLFVGLYDTSRNLVFDLGAGLVEAGDAGGKTAAPDFQISTFSEPKEQSWQDLSVANLPEIDLGTEGKDFYVWAVFYDNPSEEDSQGSLENVMRGGAFIGGFKNPANGSQDPNDLVPESITELQTYHINPGESLKVPLRMWALRRVSIHASLVNDYGGNAGWLFWQAHSSSSKNLSAANHALGVGLVPKCTNMAVGQTSPSIEGVVLGTGDRYILAGLDAYDEFVTPPGDLRARKLSYLVASPMTAPGVIWSGSVNGSTGDYDLGTQSHFSIEEKDYSMKVTVTPQLASTPGPSPQTSPYTCQ